MKIHAKYDPSFCISLQVIVIPHYSYHSVVQQLVLLQKKTIMHTTEEIKINTVKFFAVVTSASCDLIKNLIQFYASKDFTTFSGLLHF